MAKKNDNEQEIQHFDSSIVKINKDGERVLSSTLAPGERLAVDDVEDTPVSEVDVDTESDDEDVDVSTESDGDSDASTAGSPDSAAGEDSGNVAESPDSTK